VKPLRPEKVMDYSFASCGAVVALGSILQFALAVVSALVELVYTSVQQ
jgi:hypothetical protein